MQQRLVLVRQPHFEDLAAALEALQDVLDVMRQRGDRLADGGQPLRLEHGLVIARVLDGQGGLVSNGDRQFEVVLGKLAGRVLVDDDVAGRAEGIEINHAQRLVAALHRHAHRLADAEADDALARVEALVLGRVRHQDALLLAQHIVHDRAAQGKLLLGGQSLPPANGLRLELIAVAGPEHDAAAVGLDGAEDQVHHPFQELIEIEDVADRVDRLVHDRQVGQRALQPGGAGLLRLGEDAAAFGLADGLHDRRRQLQVLVLARDHADAVRQVAGPLPFTAAGAVDENALADLDAVAGSQHRFLDGLAIDERAVGAAHVDYRVRAVGLAEFRMPP